MTSSTYIFVAPKKTWDDDWGYAHFRKPSYTSSYRSFTIKHHMGVTTLIHPRDPIFSRQANSATNHWLVVSTILKNMSQWKGLSHILYMENKQCLKPPTRSHLCQFDVALRCSCDLVWFECDVSFFFGTCIIHLIHLAANLVVIYGHICHFKPLMYIVLNIKAAFSV